MNTRVLVTLLRRTGRIMPCRWASRSNFGITLKWGCYYLNVWYRPRVGYYPASLHRGSMWGEPSWVCPTQEIPVKRRMVPAAASPEDAPRHLVTLESAVLGKLSNLIAHLSVTRYDDGQPRQPGTIILRTQGTNWVMVVKEPDAACQMSLVASRLDDVLALADLMLGTDEAPWEHDPWAAKRKPTTGKKSA